MKEKKYTSKYTKRQADTAPLKECIDQMLDAYKLRGKFNEQHILNSWEKVMGAPIARRTLSLFIRHKILYVRLNSAPLKQELTMSKSKLIELLNKEAGSEVLTDVVFQ